MILKWQKWIILRRRNMKIRHKEKTEKEGYEVKDVDFKESK